MVKTLASLVLSGLLITAPYTVGPQPDPLEFTSFNVQRFPAEFSKERLTDLLQRMVDTSYMKGFRYLGDQEDFDHGHILFVDQKGTSKAVAILYHTQEWAHEFHETNPGSKYDYLDTNTRNWIQWLPGGTVENANRYIRKNYPDNHPWNKSSAYSLSENINFYADWYTVHEFMLDPTVLGGEVEYDIPVRFIEVPCGPPRNTISRESNIISIQMSLKKNVCLRIFNDQNYFQYRKARGLTIKKSLALMQGILNMV